MPNTSPNTAQQVIEAFGGLSKAARALGLPITTVHSWKESGRIPRWRVQAITDAAAKLGVEIPPELSEEAA